MIKNCTTLPKDIVEYIISFDPEGLIKREKEINKKKIQIVCDVIMELAKIEKPHYYTSYGTQNYSCGLTRLLLGLNKKDDGFKIKKQYNGYWSITHQGNKFLMKSN
jgi:hypothetical protein